jgi:sigma-E factor negative regulatory protein RseC
MRVSGVVSRVESGYAWVDVTVAQGCGRCHEPGGCGGVNIARPLAAASQTVRVRDEIGVRPGESVGLVVDDGTPLRAALLAYALPVVGVLLGAAAGTAVAPEGGSVDLTAGIGALAGGVVAFLLARGRSAWTQDAAPLRLERAGTQHGACGR